MTIRLFGMLKTMAGHQPILDVSLKGEANRVKDLIAAVDASYPDIGELIHKKKVLISVNHEIAHEESAIEETDEIALLPPFAGGQALSGKGEHPMSFDETMMARVQRDNFSVDAEIDRVRSRSRRIGGIAIFLGTARDRSQGRDVSGITFEHYEGMAQKKLQEIRERALKDFDVLEAVIVHRFGDIEIGENIVLIVVGAEHRADAFRACKWCIDELKQITPIWKLETTPQGEVWVEEHP